MSSTSEWDAGQDCSVQHYLRARVAHLLAATDLIDMWSGRLLNRKWPSASRHFLGLVAVPMGASNHSAPHGQQGHWWPAERVHSRRLAATFATRGSYLWACFLLISFTHLSAVMATRANWLEFVPAGAPNSAQRHAATCYRNHHPSM